MAALTADQRLFGADVLRNLCGGGGALFPHQVQSKAEGFSASWSMAALLLAAFGAGPLSVDRTLIQRKFQTRAGRGSGPFP